MRLLQGLNFRRRIHLLVWLRYLLWGAACIAGAVWHRHMLVLVLLGALTLLLSAALKAWESSVRRQFIREAELPHFLVGKLCAAYPQLTPRDAELVLRGLRQFFMAYSRSGRQFVAMPSKVVDAAWHEHILHTHAYQRWCASAFGGLLHHSPAEVLGRDAQRNNGLRRTWYWACKEESINPRKPQRLPLLFALDAKFAVAGGYQYVPDCSAIHRQGSSDAYCGTGMSDTSGGPGDACGLGGSDSGSHDTSLADASNSGCCGGCGGGCGGD